MPTRTFVVLGELKCRIAHKHSAAIVTTAKSVRSPKRKRRRRDFSSIRLASHPVRAKLFQQANNRHEKRNSKQSTDDVRGPPCRHQNARDLQRRHLPGHADNAKPETRRQSSPGDWAVCLRRFVWILVRLLVHAAILPDCPTLMKNAAAAKRPHAQLSAKVGRGSQRSGFECFRSNFVLGLSRWQFAGNFLK